MITDLIKWFEEKADYAQVEYKNASEGGRKIVGVYCGYVPCELVWAAGAIPVSLCGDAAGAIPAAEQVLPRTFCPLIKSSYGLAATDTCPFFHFSDCLIGETTCDGKKKVFELLAELKPIHVMQLPFRSDDPVTRDMWLNEIHKVAHYIENQVGGTITPESLSHEIKETNITRRRLQKIVSIFMDDKAPLTWTDMLRVLSAGDFLVDRAPYIEKLDELQKALDEARANGVSVYKEGAPRILITGTPMSPDTNKVMRLAEEAGGAVVCHDACSGIKGLDQMTVEDGDPYLALANRTLLLPCACMSPNPERFSLLRRVVKDYRIDGIIDTVWQGCHTFNVESALVKKVSSEELKIPYLKLETDYAVSDVGQLSTRIEAFMESLS